MKAWNFYTSRELKPRGWLRRQLEIQAQGLCGNLDKIWPDIRDSAWIGGNREGWERVPYWLDGFIPLAYLLENDDMICRAKKYVNSILAAQREDGWICPCKDSDRSSYDTWAVLLICKVLTVYYDCSRDERIPRVVYRILRNYYTLLKDGSILLFDWGKFRWYEGFIAIEFTYRHFPEAWLPELAKILKDQGVDPEALKPRWKRPLNHWRQETHIVNLAMMLKEEAVTCGLLGEEYQDRAEDMYRLLREYNGTPVGLFTGDECLSGLSPIQGTELCAVVEQMYSCELLYAYSGDDKWMERLEMLAFNALPATISDDMWTHQYVQMSNQIACQIFHGKPIFRTNRYDAHLFGLEPNFGCCTANFGQGWPKFALSTFLHNGNRIISSIPVPSELNTGDTHIVLETDYPFENRFTYSIDTAEAFLFEIRIPSFADNLRVNGAARKKENLVIPVEKGMRTVLEITFDVKPAFIQRPYELQSVRWGSLVFSLPIQYEKKMSEYVLDGVERKYPYCDYELIPQADWNYGFCDGVPEMCFNGVNEIPFSGQNPPVTVKCTMAKIDWGYEDGYETVCAKIPGSRIPLGKPETVELWPYGCSRLRMTEMPRILDSKEGG